LISTKEKFEKFKVFYTQKAAEQTLDFVNLDNFKNDLDKHLGAHMNFIDLEIGGDPNQKTKQARFKTKIPYVFSQSVRENSTFNNDKKASAHQ
jgi:hypothetical protein